MHLFSQNEELKGGILEWAPGKKLVPFHVLVCTLVCSSVCDCAPIVQACRPFKGTSIWKLAITASVLQILKVKSGNKGQCKDCTSMFVQD